MRRRTFITGVLLVFAAELLVLALFAIQMPGPEQDAVAVNMAVHSVQDDWEELETHVNQTELDYVALDLTGEVRFRTREGLSETIHAAVRHKDTILDLRDGEEVVGKLILFNDSASVWQTQKRYMTIVLAAALALQGLLGAGYLCYLECTVIRPFRKLQDFAVRVAGGNLDIPLAMDRGNLFGAFTESFDLMRSELKRARLAEAQANKSRKELVAKLSHDIRTPVASIRAAAELGAALAAAEPVSAPAAAEPVSAPAASELETVPAVSEPVSAPAAAEPVSAPAAAEPVSALAASELVAASEPEAVPAVSEPGSALAASESVAAPVAAEPVAAPAAEPWADDETTNIIITGIQENYRQILYKADQISALVNGLFTATLEELQQLPVSPADVESQEIAEMLRNADYLHCAVIPEAPECLLCADRLRLQQVFDNLFSNAYKYAAGLSGKSSRLYGKGEADGNQTSPIDVTISRDEAYLAVAIEDCGGGVAEEELPLLKEKFWRGSNCDGAEGAGLGLYISDYFMQKMQGELVIKNGEHGLLVTVRILLSGRGGRFQKRQAVSPPAPPLFQQF